MSCKYVIENPISTSFLHHKIIFQEYHTLQKLFSEKHTKCIPKYFSKSINIAAELLVIVFFFFFLKLSYM